MDCQLSLTNHSNVSLEMGNIRFLVEYAGEAVGYVELDKRILEGENIFYSSVLFTSRSEAGRQLMSNFIQGKSSKVRIRGDQSSLGYIQETIRRLSVDTTIHGIDTPLIQLSTLFILSTNPLYLTAPSQLELFNPFDAPVKIHAVRGNVLMNERIIGSIEQEGVDIEMPPKQVTVSPVLSINLKISFIAINALIQAATSQLTVDIQSVIGCSVGDFKTEIDYEQYYVPVKIL